MSFRYSALLLVISVLISCSDESETAPSALTYNPAQLTVLEGEAGSSGQPELVGSKPISFALTSSPAAGGAIFIEEDGNIRFSGELPVGTYAITVTATNIAGTTTFPEAFTITVEEAPIAPALLIYNPNRTEIIQGNAFISAVPQFEGSLPAEFTILSNPAADKISIDGSGVIRAMASLPAGNYTLNIRVSNAAGQKDFTGAKTIVVQTAASIPSGLTYSATSFEVNQGKSLVTAAPNLSGTGPFTFSVSSTPSTQGISISETGAITVNANVQPGTYVLSVSATNVAGTANFPAVLTVVVSPYTATSFSKDVRIILQMRCTGCHSNYTDYLVVKSRVDVILDRIQRAKSAIGFMPEGGEPLGPAEIETIKKWKEDGLPQ